MSGREAYTDGSQMEQLQRIIGDDVSGDRGDIESQIDYER